MTVDVKADVLDDYMAERGELVKLCLESIDYAVMGLSETAMKVEKCDYRAALLDVVKYYKGVNRSDFFDYPPVTAEVMKVADDVLADKITLVNIDGNFIRHKDGSIDWDSLDPSGNNEWPGALSRHYYILSLMLAYKQNQNQAYLDALSSHLCDFLLQAKPPMKDLSPNKVVWANLDLEGRAAPGAGVSVPKWYTLNAAIRLNNWVKVFWGLQEVDGFADNLRAVMLVSFFEHCNYLRWHHREAYNWKIYEITELACGAASFPEFTTSQQWLNYSIDELSKELDIQVYPDGTHYELSAGYHSMVLNAYAKVENVLAKSGEELPAKFAGTIKKMCEYLAFTSRNEGYAPLNNDCSLIDVRPLIETAASKYKTDELVYISSYGREGKWNKPYFGTVFEYAGHAIFRNGYAVNSDWSFFDIGPWGFGHEHNDKLHISLALGGRDILVDAGSYTYNNYFGLENKWRVYFTGSDSHNVVLIDGVGQSAYPKTTKSPIDRDDYYLSEEFSFARGTYDAGYNGLHNKDLGKFKGNAAHTRNFLYVPQFGWVAVDYIDTDRPCKVEILWHYHPDCAVETNGLMVYTNDADVSNLLIRPACDRGLSLTMIKGQEEPFVQGWYSEKMSKKAPNSVAVYEGRIEKSSVFVWLLIPSGNGKADFQGISDCRFDEAKGIVHLRYVSNKNELNAAIPVRHGRPEVSCKGVN